MAIPTFFPSGHLPRFIFSWFCVPVYNAVFVARDASPRRPPPASLRFTCRVRSARDTETSRDHLLDRTIEHTRIQHVTIQSAGTTALSSVKHMKNSLFFLDSLLLAD